jgi:hypothetical protein
LCSYVLAFLAWFEEGLRTQLFGDRLDLRAARHNQAPPAGRRRSDGALSISAREVASGGRVQDCTQALLR